MGMHKILSCLNKHVHKKNIILFNSYPDISGNALALYEYIIQYRPDILKKYRMIWTISEMSIKEAMDILHYRTGKRNHLIEYKKKLRGISLFLRAKYLVSTHSYFPTINTPDSQIDINLWHGMTFKKIGRLLNTSHYNGVQDKADISIATSFVFQGLISEAFGIPKSRVLVTGQPCNDFLYRSNKYLFRVMKNAHNYNKRIVWLPTYRTSIIGDIRQDGNADSFGVVDVLQNHFKEIDDCLKKENYLLIIKPHPMDAICSIQFRESDNIKLVYNSDLEKERIQLYEFLAGCDVLLTDYSSVFIDFLATGKPIAFICDDIAEYEKSRGFCFSSPRDYMPGELIKNINQFIHYLKDMDEINNQWKDKYKEIQTYFNPFCDRKSSERVCNELWGESDGKKKC